MGCRGLWSWGGGGELWFWGEKGVNENALRASLLILRRVLGGTTSEVTLVKRKHIAGKPIFLRRVLGGSTSVVTPFQRKHVAGKPIYFKLIY